MRSLVGYRRMLGPLRRCVLSARLLPSSVPRRSLTVHDIGTSEAALQLKYNADMPRVVDMRQGQKVRFFQWTSSFRKPLLYPGCKTVRFPRNICSEVNGGKGLLDLLGTSNIPSCLSVRTSGTLFEAFGNLSVHRCRRCSPSKSLDAVCNDSETT